MDKHHLGSCVYAQEDDGFILLTDENTDTEGNPIIVSAVYLSPDSVCELQRYLANRKVANALKQSPRK